jgi:hypothetical protein
MPSTTVGTSWLSLASAASSSRVVLVMGWFAHHGLGPDATPSSSHVSSWPLQADVVRSRVTIVHSRRVRSCCSASVHRSTAGLL